MHTLTLVTKPIYIFTVYITITWCQEYAFYLIISNNINVYGAIHINQGTCILRIIWPKRLATVHPAIEMFLFSAYKLKVTSDQEMWSWSSSPEKQREDNYIV